MDIDTFEKELNNLGNGVPLYLGHSASTCLKAIKIFKEEYEKRY